MINPITVQETSKATRFELDKNAAGYQLMNEAARQTEQSPGVAGRARVFIGMALIRAGEYLSQAQIVPAPEGKNSQ